MNLTKFSLKNPLVVVIFWLTVLVFGFVSLKKIPLDFFPESKSLAIAINTAYPGAAKGRVLREVTKKLELELSQVRGIETLVSTTQNESSQILAHFAYGANKEDLLPAVLLAVNGAKATFAEGVMVPSIQVVEKSVQPVLRVAMNSSLSPAEFYDFAYSKIGPEFKEMEGISRVEIEGGRQRQVTVKLDLDKMKEREISMGEVAARLNSVGKNGYLGKNGSYFLFGTISSINELKETALRYLANDQVIALKDIAKIDEELSEPEVYTYYNGDPCLMLEIYARSDADLLTIEKIFSKKIEALSKKLSKGKEKVSFFQLTSTPHKLTFIEDDFHRNTAIAIIVALLLIAMVFKDMRSILISSTSIPTSLCGTFIVMHLLGYSLNSFTIPAVIISIGLVIDDMIVIRENIFRHLEEGLSPFEATLVGMREVTRPVIGTTCMVFSVCLPLIVLTGTETGQYWRNFGITMLAGMAFSLLEALSLGPLLCAYCLKPRGHEPFKQPIQELVRATYDRLLRLARDLPKAVMGGGGVLMILGFLVFALIKAENMPLSTVGSMEISLKVAGDKPAREVEGLLLRFSDHLFHHYPDIAKVGVSVRNRSDICLYLEMVEEKERNISAEKLALDIGKQLKALQNQKMIESYFVDAHVLSPVLRTWDYAVHLSSFDKAELKEYSEKLFLALQGFQGVNNLSLSSNIEQIETAFLLDFDKMRKLGVLTHPVQNELTLLVNGVEPTEFRPEKLSDAQKPEIKLETEIASLNSEELLDRAWVPNVNQMLVPLREVTKETRKERSVQVMRKNRQELIEVNADENSAIPHESLLHFTHKLMKKELPLPEGVAFSWAGMTRQAQEMISMEPKLALLAAFFIYTTLVILYQSVTMPFVIFLPLPFAISACFFALYLTGHTINTYSIIGILIIAGLAAKNGIVLIDYTNQLIDKGASPTHAIFDACRVRLRAILMSSLAVFLTTIPVLIVWDEFSKVQVSLAIAIMGGLITSTLFTLFIIPIFFKYSYRFHAWISEKMRNILFS